MSLHTQQSLGEALTVPGFHEQTELQAAMYAKANFINRDLYPRDGSARLGELESRVAELAGVAETEVLAYNSGMSAVAAALDVGLHLAGRIRPGVAASQEFYSQSKRYLEHFLNPYRANVTIFNGESTEGIEDALTRPGTDVVVAETITNYQNIPVLDVNRLLGITRELKDAAPVVVLDNTLPLSTGLAIGEMLTPDDRIIVVESGTKSYSMNKELLGVGYTKNEELLHWLRRYRRTRGDLPGNASAQAILNVLPENRQSFDERNRRLFKATAEIALTLAGCAVEAGNDELLIVHPAIPNHPNAALYARQHPQGGAPVLYVNAASNSELDQHELLHRVWSHPDVRSQAVLGQSFGFDEARIIYDEYLPMIRIAGGANTDGKALGAACAAALFA